jgi:hypothetical protein
MTIEEIKASLDVCDKMIDALNRKMYSNESIMGMMSDAFERMSEDEKEQYAVNRQQLTSLLNYRSSLLNEAIDVMSSSDVPLTKIEGFSF